MMRFVIPGLFFTLLCGCGDSRGFFLDNAQSTAQQPMMQGKLAAPEEFSETGALVGERGWLCSGTLIGPQLVLTAGHCVMDVSERVTFVPKVHPFPLSHGPAYRVIKQVRHPDYNIDAYVGSPLWMRLNEPRSEQERIVAEMVVSHCGKMPSQFRTRAWMQCLLQMSPEIQNDLGLTDANIKPNDIALMVLQHPVRDASVAALPTTDTEVRASQMGTVVGYGVHEKTSIFRIPFAERYVGQVVLDLVGPFEMEIVKGPSMLGPGDSGGPIYSGDGGERQIWGVLSRGRQVQASDFIEDFGVYTRVDPYVPWIEETRRRLRL